MVNAVMEGVPTWNNMGADLDWNNLSPIECPRIYVAWSRYINPLSKYIGERLVSILLKEII